MENISLVTHVLEFATTSLNVGGHNYLLPTAFKYQNAAGEHRHTSIEQCREVLLRDLADTDNLDATFDALIAKAADGSEVKTKLQEAKASLSGKTVAFIRGIALTEHVLVDNDTMGKINATPAVPLDATDKGIVKEFGADEREAVGADLESVLHAKITAPLTNPIYYLVCSDLSKQDQYHELYIVYPTAGVTVVVSHDVFAYLDAHKGTSATVQDFIKEKLITVDHAKKGLSLPRTGFRHPSSDLDMKIKRRTNKDGTFKSATIDYVSERIPVSMSSVGGEQRSIVDITDSIAFSQMMELMTGKTSIVDQKEEGKKKGIKIIDVRKDRFEKAIKVGKTVLLVGSGVFIAWLYGQVTGKGNQNVVPTATPAIYQTATPSPVPTATSFVTAAPTATPVAPTATPFVTAAPTATPVVPTATPQSEPVAEEGSNVEQNIYDDVYLVTITQGMERVGYEANSSQTYEQIMESYSIQPTDGDPVYSTVSYDFVGNDQVVLAYLDSLHDAVVNAHYQGKDKDTRTTIKEYFDIMYNFVMNDQPVEINGKVYRYSDLSINAKNVAFYHLYGSMTAFQFSGLTSTYDPEELIRIATYVEDKQAELGLITRNVR